MHYIIFYIQIFYEHVLGYIILSKINSRSFEILLVNNIEICNLGSKKFEEVCSTGRMKNFGHIRKAILSNGQNLNLKAIIEHCFISIDRNF